jgi:hypothetical protein
MSTIIVDSARGPFYRVIVFFRFERYAFLEVVKLLLKIPAQAGWFRT